MFLPREVLAAVARVFRREKWWISSENSCIFNENSCIFHEFGRFFRDFSRLFVIFLVYTFLTRSRYAIGIFSRQIFVIFSSKFAIFRDFMPAGVDFR